MNIEQNNAATSEAIEISEQNSLDPSPLYFDPIVGAGKVLLTIPVRKPNRQGFVRGHGSPESNEQLILDRCKAIRLTQAFNKSNTGDSKNRKNFSR